jgi:crotonobetainyl-CoA:carnitine CoA-transferase CaiB-like acyl-CoA transferase
MVTSQDIDDVGEMGAMFMAANRSKRGLALNYREPDGLKALLRILAQADSHGRVCH